MLKEIRASALRARGRRRGCRSRRQASAGWASPVAAVMSVIAVVMVVVLLVLRLPLFTLILIVIVTMGLWRREQGQFRGGLRWAK